MNTDKEISMRAMTLEDLDAVMAIEQATQINPWDKVTFEGLLKNHQGIVAMIDDEIIGFVLFSLASNEAEILTISIAQAFQNKGYGRALLSHVISFLQQADINKIFLEVRQSNKSAIKLYEGLGFLLISKRKDYYKTETGREDGLMYSLAL